MSREPRVAATRARGERVFGEGRCVPLWRIRKHLGGCGLGVRLFEGARIIQPARVRVGNHVQIDEGVLVVGGVETVFGDHVHLAAGSQVIGGGVCILGDFCGVSAGVKIVTGSDLADGSGLTNPTVSGPARAVRRSFVRAGPHVLIYANAVILPGVTLGDGAVVGAGCVVHRDLKPWTIYAGNPVVAIGARPKRRILELAKALAGEERFPAG